jgi:hypothetical protein
MLTQSQLRPLWTYLLHQRAYPNATRLLADPNFCSKPRRSPPAHVLAGVDDLLIKSHGFCRRMFALYEAGAIAGRMSAFFRRTSCF